MAGGGVKINNIAITGGANGRTPTFKIENGKLYNSYDSGVTWHELGQVAGDNGTDGQDGKGFNPRGVWQPNTTYFNNAQQIDVVQYGANSYYCRISHTGGSDPASDTINWGILVEGGVSGQFYFGEGITGTNTTPQVFPNSGVSNASVGDVYWNMSNGVNRGNMYKCELGGGAATATWSYAGNISTVETVSDTSTTAISYTIEANTQKAFKAANISSVTLTIPATTYQGFISEVDLVVGNNAPTLQFVNNSGKPFSLVRYGLVFDSYTLSANTEVNLLFRDNGISVVCAILEI